MSQSVIVRPDASLADWFLGVASFESPELGSGPGGGGREGSVRCELPGQGEDRRWRGTNLSFRLRHFTKGEKEGKESVIDQASGGVSRSPRVVL